MSFTLCALRGVVGGAAGAITGHLIRRALESGIPNAAVAATPAVVSTVASSALSAMGTTAKCLVIAGIGLVAARFAYQQTDITRNSSDYLVDTRGWGMERVDNLHTYVPALIFGASLTPLAYHTMRIFI